jgi:hypothetical protein
MTAEQYIQKRLQHQIDWYSNKSLRNQRIFKRLRIAEIVAAALIPFLSGLSISLSSFRIVGTIIVGALGMSVAIIAGVLSLGQHQEHWVDYRTVSENLKKEKVFFETKVAPYNGDDSFKLLVQRVETLVSSENANWSQFMMKAEDIKKPKD